MAEQLPPQVRFRPGPATDPIDMEFILQAVDPATRSELVRIRLETVSKVFGAISEGAAAAARHVASNPAAGGGG